MSLLARALVGLIRLYRLAVSPYLPMGCRFEPSCSCYAAEAIAQHGCWRGLRLAARRLARCHPWGGMGYDPVPKPKSGPYRAYHMHGAGRVGS